MIRIVVLVCVHVYEKKPCTTLSFIWFSTFGRNILIVELLLVICWVFFPKLTTVDLLVFM